MASHSATIHEGGRMVVPADLLRELGLQDGDTVVIEMIEGMLRSRSRDAVITEIQALARGFVPEGVSVVEELIAERRAEVARE
ncbi:AbrB/MazE/SpoVT family DNA-binding domain-containing protein [Methylobacterium terricola]|uniref:AbrB/MazE/SpoVT family DNA-binding domain-containing protein n=1 Tax=Methylobacterium terricola TaxID=2583531 RepID=A0A5C4L9C7_9HYPH|nr:AbrB/MazE/SpoVT family DNA-binding domain-containing protein [Methylobacterium terricola]TNC07291.1 AbrB/MazE/SpoVT family DNA-binding domain-containing protein [Methylobacterium terricola]